MSLRVTMPGFDQHPVVAMLNVMTKIHKNQRA
jgi:hypothetical protein